MCFLKRLKELVDLASSAGETIPKKSSTVTEATFEVVCSWPRS